MTNPCLPTAARSDQRALRILARSLARELTSDGLDARQLIVLASELLDEATARLRAARMDVASATTPIERS